MAQNEILSSMEYLMQEFFNPDINRTRKAEIEKELNNFRNQRDCWKLCIHFINHSANSYVLMFAFTTIEAVIKHNWQSLEWEQRTEIKTSLYNALVEQTSGVTYFVRFKLSKLLCDIARHDLPDLYNFFGLVVQLLHSEHQQYIGLILLRTISEEFTNSNCDVNTKRKEELLEFLQQHIHQTLQVLTSILEYLCSRTNRSGVTATPPPSPSNPGAEQHYLSMRVKPDSKILSRELLMTLQHLFTWIQLTHLPAELIKGLFHYINVLMTVQDEDMCILALSTVNELMYRKCIPPNTQNLYVDIYHNSVHMLKVVLCPSNNILCNFDIGFLNKLCELLSLLVEQHLWRLESEAGFSALEFLSLLFQCTIQLASADGYLACLNVWLAFMKQLKPQNASKYFEALNGLTTTVINKLQLAYNKTQLESLNKIEILEDNDVTEWTKFLDRSVEVLTTTKTFSPVETFNQVYVAWKALNDVYLTLNQAVNKSNNTLSIDMQMAERLHCILNDLTTLTHTLARLSSTVSQDEEPVRALDTLIEEFFMELMRTAVYTSKASFYKLQASNLQQDFIELHAEVLASVKTTYNLVPEEKLNVLELVSLTTPILLSGAQEPLKLSCSSAQLFLTITIITQPLVLIRMPPVIHLVHNVHNIVYSNSETTVLVYNALCNILLKEAEITFNDAEAQQKNILTKTLFDNLTKNFRELQPTCVSEEVAKKICITTLPILNNIVKFFRNHATHAKKRLYQETKPVLDHVVTLFPTYSVYNEVSDAMLDLYGNMLGTLQQQLGVSTIISDVQVFLRTSMSTHHQNNNSCGIDRILHLLRLVIEAPGLPITNLIPDILELCIQQVLPIAFQQNNPNMDAPIALLSLLHSLLLYRWQYFYLSQVRLGNSPGCSDIEAAPDCSQQPEKFLSILQVFGQALMQTDVNIFRTSLLYLENLNSKWKLYFKGLFRERLLEEFLTVLLQTLINKSQALLNDEITLAVYNLASVNFPVFFGVFFPKFLSSLEGLPLPQRSTLQQSFLEVTDQPTFVANLNRTVSDICYYLLCNNC